MIEELVTRVFATRNAVHLAHWAETSGWRHGVLGDFYDSLIDKLDSIVEAHQGAYGLIGDVNKGLRLMGAALFLFVVAASLAACESAGRFAAYCIQNPRNCD